jgi:hypothetical protein
LRLRLKDDDRKHPARSDTKQQPDKRPAGQQNQHAAERGGRNLPGLST